jgi:hypothetical protein
MLHPAMAQSGQHRAQGGPTIQGEKTAMTKTQNDQPGKEEAAPSTGFGLEPLFKWHGQSVYPVFGAEGDDDPSGEPDSDPGTGEGGGTGESDDKPGSETVSREDFLKLKAQLQAADKNKAAAEKKLKDIEDGKKDELTKATERAEELEKQVAQRDKDLAELRLQNAFLSADAGVQWHDNGDALVLAERKGYLADVVGEDGTVDAKKLATKLKEMASKHPHLVKSGSNDGSSEDKPKPPASGTKVGNKTKTSKDEPDLSRYSRFLNT